MVVSTISLIFTPTWGSDPIWLIFFQMGWFNHQLVYLTTVHRSVGKCTRLVPWMGHESRPLRKKKRFGFLPVGIAPLRVVFMAFPSSKMAFPRSYHISSCSKVTAYVHYVHNYHRLFVGVLIFDEQGFKWLPRGYPHIPAVKAVFGRWTFFWTIGGTVDVRNSGVHQLRLVVYPVIF